MRRVADITRDYKRKKTRFQGILEKKTWDSRDSTKKRAKKSWDSLEDSKKQLVRIPEKKLSFFFGIPENFIGIT